MEKIQCSTNKKNSERNSRKNSIPSIRLFRNFFFLYKENISVNFLSLSFSIFFSSSLNFKLSTRHDTQFLPKLNLLSIPSIFPRIESNFPFVHASSRNWKQLDGERALANCPNRRSKNRWVSI